MRFVAGILFCAGFLLFGASHAAAQADPCPRPGPGGVVTDPEDLYSQNGTLTVNFTLVSEPGPSGSTIYCYVYTDGNQSPTLHLNPGDALVLNLTNSLSAAVPVNDTMTSMPAMSTPPANTPQNNQNGPCVAGPMNASMTNLHFHGLNVAPTCHQDDTISTMIAPGTTFKYAIRIPSNEPPGLYWYHPHAHGFVEGQVIGGATGAIVIEGIEQVKPQVAGLPTRLFVIRDLVTPGAPPNRTRNPAAGQLIPKYFTINFNPANYPTFPLPTISMKPSEKQFWRVLNSCADTSVNLEVKFGGSAQTLQLVSLDGVPIRQTGTQAVTGILIPPAGRAEFIVTGPASGVPAQLISNAVDTGKDGEYNPTRPIATILASANAPAAKTKVPTAPTVSGTQRFSWLDIQQPTVKRNLVFSEVNPADPVNGKFYITVVGQTPHVFTVSEPPAITTTIGSVEDWTIENRAQEDHVFHIHQLHFLLVAINGVTQTSPNLLDTVQVPHWDGVSATYPSVTLRMDFRDPNIAGTFVYHCHILDHEDAGMMAKIQVNPAN